MSNLSVLFFSFSDQMSRRFSVGPALGSSTVKDIGTIPYLESDSLNEKFRMFNPENWAVAELHPQAAPMTAAVSMRRGTRTTTAAAIVIVIAIATSLPLTAILILIPIPIPTRIPITCFKGEGYGTARKQQEVKEARQKIATAALRHLHELGWTREALAAGTSLIRQLIDRSIDPLCD